MKIEIRINENYSTNWDSIKVEKTEVKDINAANDLVKVLAGMKEREVRWNEEGLQNGHYVGSEFKHKVVLEFEKNLVISAGHISYKDSLRLKFDTNNRYESYSLIVNENPYGWDVHLDQDSESIDAMDKKIANNYSEAFGKVIKLARENDCHWVKFDADGPFYANMEIFNW